MFPLVAAAAAIWIAVLAAQWLTYVKDRGEKP